MWWQRPLILLWKAEAGGSEYEVSMAYIVSFSPVKTFSQRDKLCLTVYKIEHFQKTQEQFSLSKCVNMNHSNIPLYWEHIALHWFKKKKKSIAEEWTFGFNYKACLWALERNTIFVNVRDRTTIYNSMSEGFPNWDFRLKFLVLSNLKSHWIHKASDERRPAMVSSAVSMYQNSLLKAETPGYFGLFYHCLVVICLLSGTGDWP